MREEFIIKRKAYTFDCLKIYAKYQKAKRNREAFIKKLVLREMKREVGLAQETIQEYKVMGLAIAFKGWKQVIVGKKRQRQMWEQAEEFARLQTEKRLFIEIKNWGQYIKSIKHDKYLTMGIDEDFFTVRLVQHQEVSRVASQKIQLSGAQKPLKHINLAVKTGIALLD